MKIEVKQEKYEWTPVEVKITIDEREMFLALKEVVDQAERDGNEITYTLLNTYFDNNVAENFINNVISAIVEHAN